MKKTDNKIVEALKVLINYGPEIVETAEKLTDLNKIQEEKYKQEAEVFGVCPDCGDSECESWNAEADQWEVKSPDPVFKNLRLGPMAEEYKCPDDIETIHQEMRDFDIEEAYNECSEKGNVYVGDGLKDTLQLIARNPYLVETVILYAMRKHNNQTMGVMNKNAQMMFHFHADQDELIEHYGSEFTEHPAPYECDDICPDCLEDAA